MKSPSIFMQLSLRRDLVKAVSFALVLCSSLVCHTASAGSKPATLSGSSSMVGNLFVTNTSITSITAPTTNMVTVISPVASVPLITLLTSQTNTMPNIISVLGSVNVTTTTGSGSVNLATAIQTTMSSPTAANLLNAVQLTILALQQYPNNPAVVQLSRELVAVTRTP